MGIVLLTLLVYLHHRRVLSLATPLTSFHVAAEAECVPPTPIEYIGPV